MTGRFERSTKRDLSYFEHVSAFHSKHDNCSRRKDNQPKAKAKARGTHGSMQQKRTFVIHQFHVICHPYIVDVVDVIARQFGYRCIVVLLGMGEDSWLLIRHDLFK